jgi:alpha-tubulin suppressor-like RCC1 family protein
MRQFKSLILFILLSNIIHSQCVQNFSAGDWSCFAIKSDGILHGWGQKNYGPNPGTNGTSTPLAINSDTDWSTVSAGGEFLVAKKNNGTIWKYNLNYFPYYHPSNIQQQPVQIGVDNDWDKVVLGTAHVLAIKTNGTLWSWGQNNYGQLGIGNLYDQSIPIQVGNDSNWEKIFAGTRHSLGLKSDGSLWAWGQGWYGQLGNWNEVNSSTPVYVGTTSDWLTATAGIDRSFGIKTNGTLWAWGLNNHGQLGTGNLNNSNTPIQIGTDTNWVDVVSYSNDSGLVGYTIALKSNGTIWGWGYSAFSIIPSGSYVYVPTQIGLANDWAKLDPGINHVIAMKTDGTLWVWGSDGTGTFGDGAANLTHTNIPQLINCSTLTENVFQSIEVSSTYIYPNPAKDEFNFAGIEEESNYQIINSLGQIIQSDMATNNSEIKIEGLANGIYYVKVNNQVLRLEKN